MVCIVTGGAGFIGSHLVDALVEKGEQVRVIDSLVDGDIRNIEGPMSRGAATFIKADLRFSGWEEALQGVTRVYHLAANPDVQQGSLAPDSQIDNNILATYRVLEAMRRHGVPEIVFTSTSTVYGEAAVIPTPETYQPLQPVSVYGACKLSCEALISAYCHGFGMTGWVYRFANIIGERSGHGVITDFIRKLRENPKELEILGNGKQIKSYMEVCSCVRAMLYATAHSHDRFNVFNVGTEDWVDVTTIADTVATEMGLPGVRYRYTGGERGWVGDVPRMQLSVEKLKGLGWVPDTDSARSLATAVRQNLGKQA